MSVGVVSEALRAMSPGERDTVRVLLDALPDAVPSDADAARARVQEAGLSGETHTLINARMNGRREEI